MKENTVKRYDVKAHSQGPEMVENIRGEFVKYKDYKELLRQLTGAPKEKLGRLRFHPTKGHIIE
jgi:hypothetical protein